MKDHVAQFRKVRVEGAIRDGEPPGHATMTWSRYQQDIFQYFQCGVCNAVVDAVAGSGKTSTIIEGLKHLDSQASACVVAFNKIIVEELGRRVPEGVRVATFNSIGHRALLKGSGINLKPDSKLLRESAKDLAAKLNLPLLKRARYVDDGCAMVSRAKNLGVPRLLPDSAETWREIAEQVDALGDKDTCEFAAQLLERSVEMAGKDNRISFDDQIYLPLLHEVALPQFDLVAVDEAQDLNPVQHALLGRMLRPGGRLIAVGDPRQAIYAFRGADAESFASIRSRFECHELPLYVCYRCSRAVVEYAQSLVPHLESFAGAPPGEVREGVHPAWETLRPGEDVVLCRNNAPLAKLALSLLARGIAARIAGREDYARGLKKVVERCRERSLPGVQGELKEWLDAEIKRLVAADKPEKIEAVEDRYECLVAVIRSLPPRATVEDLESRLDGLFSDPDRRGALELATIHKAKGREWARVFVLKPGLMPSRWAKSDTAKAQERNLQYVCFTRAKYGLYLLDDEIGTA